MKDLVKSSRNIAAQAVREYRRERLQLTRRELKVETDREIRDAIRQWMVGTAEVSL